MDLSEAIRERRSIRVFRPGAVPEEVERSFKDAIRFAPSAGHIQARHFHFVTDRAAIQRLGTTSFQAGIFEHAALVVVGSTHERIVAEYGERGRDLYAPQDVAAAAQNLLLTVHAAGFGAVWIGAFHPDQVKAVLGAGDDMEPVVMIPIGVPDETPEKLDRLPDDQLFTDVG